MRVPNAWRTVLSLAVLLVIPALLRCGGGSGGSGGSGGGANPQFNLSIPNPPSPILAGGSGTATVNVTRSGGEDQAITLSLVSPPTGITGSGTIPASAGSGTLNLQVASSVQNLNGGYTLTVQGSDGTITQSTQTSLMVAIAAVPAAPTGLNATAANGTVTIGWTLEATATSYNLYWSNSATVAPGKGTQVPGLTTSPYVQTVPADGLTYYYVVTGVNAEGEGAPSASAQALPVAAPTVLAPGQNGPYGLAVANGSLYWLNALDGTLMTVPCAGGTPTALVTGLSYPPNGLGGNPIASDGTNVYWTNSKTGEVAQVTIATQVVTPLYLPGSDVTVLGLAIDAANVYWAEPGDGTLKMAPIGGAGSVSTLLTGVGNVHCLAVDATNLYFSDPTSGTVNKLNLSTLVVTVLASNLASPGYLAVDADNVYWTDALQGALYAIAINVTPAPGTPTLLASESANGLGGLVVHGGSIYWIDATGWVRKIPIGGGTITTLGTGPGGACLAVDATQVYWDFMGTGLGGGYVDGAPN